MLPYTKQEFLRYLDINSQAPLEASEVWYEERTDFSDKSIGINRVEHREDKGFELLQGPEQFKGRLLGGCLESMYDILTISRYEDEKDTCEKYSLFPEKEEWEDKILFIETCEEKPSPDLFKKELIALKEKGVFDKVNGIIVGKPQDECYYQEYKELLKEVVDDKALPILYNVNFGHAYPRCVLPYGVEVQVNYKEQTICFVEKLFE
jgi:muramoyltetrapeptide carboxypeptidase LdcA involved in peptidoglycan recycling